MDLLPNHIRDALDDIAHELDMLVYRLEQPERDGEPARLREREAMRRDLERLRQRLLDAMR